MVTAVEDRSRSKSDRLSCGVLVRISCLAGLRRAGWRAVELGGGKVRDYRRPGRRCQKLGERGRSRCTPGDHVDSFDDMASFVIDSVAGWLIRDGAADLRRGARHDDQSIAPCCRHGNGARAGQDDCSGGKGWGKVDRKPLRESAPRSNSSRNQREKCLSKQVGFHTRRACGSWTTPDRSWRVGPTTLAKLLSNSAIGARVAPAMLGVDGPRSYFIGRISNQRRGWRNRGTCRWLRDYPRSRWSCSSR